MARLLGVTEGMVAAIARSRRPDDTPAPMTDTAIERLIERVGAERVWSALDRLTAPATAESAI
jgi:hypothetical protein